MEASRLLINLTFPFKFKEKKTGFSKEIAHAWAETKPALSKEVKAAAAAAAAAEAFGFFIRDKQLALVLVIWCVTQKTQDQNQSKQALDLEPPLQ